MNELGWEAEEARRKSYCKEFDIPYITIPWPGKEGHMREETPGNKEAFQAMIEQNPVFKEYSASEVLKLRIRAGTPPGWEWIPVQRTGTGHRVTIEAINERVQRWHREHPSDPETQVLWEQVMAEGSTTFRERWKLLGLVPNDPGTHRGQEGRGVTRTDFNEDGRTPRIQRREQTLGEWIVINK
jgi:hypothetical protein